MDGPSRRPSEQHRNEGSLSKAKTRMQGGVSFAYFALHKQRKVRRRARRNLEPWAEEGDLFVHSIRAR